MHVKGIYAANSSGMCCRFVSCNTMIIVSKKDEAIPVRVADYIFSKISSAVKKTVVLENTPHCSTDGPEKELIADYLAKWFKKEI